MKAVTAFWLALIPVLTGCTTLQTLYHDTAYTGQQLGLVQSQQYARTGNWVFSPHSRFFVATGDSGAQSLDQAVTELVARHLSGHFPGAVSAEQGLSLELARGMALSHNADYLVYSSVLIWEDTVASWSQLSSVFRRNSVTCDAERIQCLDEKQMRVQFGRNRARLQLIIIDAVGGQTVDRVTIDAQGGLLSFYRDSPPRLLAEAMQVYVRSLVPYQANR